MNKSTALLHVYKLSLVMAECFLYLTQRNCTIAVRTSLGGTRQVKLQTPRTCHAAFVSIENRGGVLPARWSIRFHDAAQIVDEVSLVGSVDPLVGRHARDVVRGRLCDLLRLPRVSFGPVVLLSQVREIGPHGDVVNPRPDVVVEEVARRCLMVKQESGHGQFPKCSCPRRSASPSDV